MSQIHINRAGQNLGSFSLEEVQKGIVAGRFVGGDLGWQSGMASWKPLSTWPEITLPVEPPPLDLPPLVGDLLPGAEGDGPTWERREQIGYLQALGWTVKEVLLEPAATFARLRQNGGFAAPLTYFILTGMVGGMFSLAYQFIMRGTGLTANGMRDWPPALRQWLAPDHLTISYLIGTVFGMLVFAPIVLALASFLQSGITHLCLLLLGGARKPFETTYRVICYSMGSCRILGVLPVCGDLAGYVWGFVASAIGLARAHQTETWRAVLAVLLPLIVCCGLGFAGLATLLYALQGEFRS